MLSVFDLVVEQIASDRRRSVLAQHVRLVGERFDGNIGILALVYPDSSAVNRALCGGRMGAPAAARVTGMATGSLHMLRRSFSPTVTPI